MPFQLLVETLKISRSLPLQTVIELYKLKPCLSDGTAERLQKVLCPKLHKPSRRKRITLLVSGAFVYREPLIEDVPGVSGLSHSPPKMARDCRIGCVLVGMERLSLPSRGWKQSTSCCMCLK